jgi:hypothetical protein
MFANLVYGLCALTSLLAMALLIRAYFRSRERVILWVAIAFFGLALNNVLLLIDLALIPRLDLMHARAISFLLAQSCLLFGLIRETA